MSEIVMATVQQRRVSNARVQARLCGRTGTKEPSVDGGHVSVRVQDRQGYQAHQDDVRI